MYQILTGGQVLYDPAQMEERPVIAPHLTQELNQSGVLSFTLIPGHPLYNSVKPLETYLAAYDDGEETFYGRVISRDDPQISGQIAIQCEGALSFLEDAEVPPDSNNSSGTTRTAEEFFRWCIDHYNTEIRNDSRRKLTVGEVRHSKKDEVNTYTFSSYTSVKSALDTMLIGVVGGFLRIRSDGNGGHYIDWIEDYGRVDQQEIVLGENVIDQANNTTTDKMFTVLRPVGADKITLDEGTLDVYPAADMQKYGRIIKTINYNDAKNKTELREKALKTIEKIQKTVFISSEVRFVDMHYVDGTTPKMHLGDVLTNVHGLEGIRMLVSNLERDFENPGNDRLNLKNPKQYEPNNLDGRGGTGSSGSRKSSSGYYAQTFKYINEIEKTVTINSDVLEIHTKQIDISADNITQLSRRADDADGRITEAEAKLGWMMGTGVIQNSEHITMVAGKFNVNKDTGDVELSQGTDFVLTENGAKITVIDLWAHQGVIEGSALWTERDSITGVTGMFEVRNGDLYIYDGAGLYMQKDSTAFGVYHNGNLTGGIMVDKINNDGTVQTKIKGDLVDIKATQMASIGIYTDDHYDAGLIIERLNDGSTSSKISGDMVDIKASQMAAIGIYTDDHYDAGFIVQRINNQTAAKISAANVTIDAGNSVRLQDKFTFTDTYLWAKASIYATPGCVFNGDHVGSFYYANQEQGHSVYYGILKKAKVEDNTLKIWKFGDAESTPSVTFNKAVSLSGSWNGTTTYSVSATSGVISGTAPKTTVFLAIEGTANPNEKVYAKIYKDNPNVLTNQLTSTEMTLGESTSGKYVELYIGSGTSKSQKGKISTAATYNAGWDFGQTKRTRSTRAATSQELTVKTLDYGQRWTIVDTYTASNGTTSDVKYTVESKADRWNDGYDTAKGYVGMPGAGTGTTFTVKVPNDARNGQDDKTFTVTKGSTPSSSGYASVVYNNNTVGRISIGNWYTAGWDYGQTQKTRTTRDATSQELTVKTLDYGQRWTIVDTYTASNGTTSDVKYTVASKGMPSATISFDCTDLGDPAYDESNPEKDNDKAITATAKNGDTTLGTGTQVIHMTQGTNWNNGRRAINARMTNASGKLLDRIWVEIPTLSMTCRNTAAGYYTITATCGGKTLVKTLKLTYTGSITGWTFN